MVSYIQRETTDLPIPRIGKDEMNLCELPIARLGSRDKRAVIEFTGEVVKDGKTIIQEWVVSGSAKVGLPTEFAERVLIALISIAAAERFQTRKTSFTVYEVLKLMGVGTDGRYYQDVTLAIKRLHGVTITGKNTWWDNDIKKYRNIEKGIHLLEDYWLESLSDEEDKAEMKSGGYVVWNEGLWESFQAGYLKNLDTQFYYGLDSTLARRLYRFLDKRMHYQDSYQIDIFALAARLGMVAYRYPSQIKEKLQPAFDELIDRDYLVSATAIKFGKFTRVKFVRPSARQAYQAELWDDAPETPAETASGSLRDAEAALDGETGTQVRESSLMALYVQYNTPETFKQAWQDILHECAGTMTFDSYQMIADSALLDIEQEVAVIVINVRNRDWIVRQMRRKFMNQLNQYLGVRVKDIRFIDLSNVNH